MSRLSLVLLIALSLSHCGRTEQSSDLDSTAQEGGSRTEESTAWSPDTGIDELPGASGTIPLLATLKP
jgi:hypothetical protein